MAQRTTDFGYEPNLLIAEEDDKKVHDNFKPGEEMEIHKQNAIQILQWSNATPIRLFGGRGYECCFCDEQFPDPADLKKHCTESHDMVKEIVTLLGKEVYRLCIKLDITALRCLICNESIETVEILMQHLIKAHNKRIHVAVKHHILPFKFDCEYLRCYICHNLFNTFKPLLEHMNIHYKNFKCDKCDAGFVNRNKLYYHKVNHNTGSFGCDHCPKVFTTNLKKKAHEVQVHSLSKLRNKCRYCGAKFKDARRKDMHIAKEHEVNTVARKCQACEKTFAHQHGLMVHMKRHHLVERPHKCELCEKEFFSSSELKGHMLTHTGLKEFECKICSKTFGRRWTLTEHLRIHANDRRYKCEFCSMTFVQKCSWKGHLKTKHGADIR